MQHDSVFATNTRYNNRGGILSKKKVLVRKVYHAFWEIEIDDGDGLAIPDDKQQRNEARKLAENLQPDDFEHFETEYSVLSPASEKIGPGVQFVDPTEENWIDWFSD